MHNPVFAQRLRVLGSAAFFFAGDSPGTGAVRGLCRPVIQCLGFRVFSAGGT